MFFTPEEISQALKIIATRLLALNHKKEDEKIMEENGDV